MMGLMSPSPLFHCSINGRFEYPPVIVEGAVPVDVTPVGT